MVKIRSVRAPVPAKKKAAILTAVLALLAVASVAYLGKTAADNAATPEVPSSEDGYAVSPLTPAMIEEHYGGSADPEARDRNGTPVFSYAAAADEGKVFFDPETGEVRVETSYGTPEQRAALFGDSTSARLAAAETGNALVLAVLSPTADQGFITALPPADTQDDGAPEGSNGAIADYLPSKQFRERITDVRYSSFRMSMGHYVRDGGDLLIIGVLDVQGTLRFDGEPRDFHFYTDYSTDAQGDLNGLSNFLLSVSGVPVTSQMVSLQ